MDLRQLNALVAVADHGGFSAAAEALHTVQSNVSSHVARLEHELGTVLVDRAAGRLTTEGETVVARARRVHAELEGLVADVAALRDDIRGSTRLGMIGTIARWLAPRLLAVVQERHPGIHLVIVDATSASLEPRLSSGSLDLAVINLPLPAGDLVGEPLFDEDLMLVVPARHPLGARDAATVADLDGLGLLVPPRGTAFRDEIDRAAKANGFAVTPLAELDGVRLIASLALEGHGPAILPATAVPIRARPGPWRALPVAGLPRRRVGIAQRRRGLPAAPTRAVLEVVRDITSGSDRPSGIHAPAAGQSPTS